ncbi:hypothetical protein [Azospirillum baldaniorum]|uniref:hypothetical protein n=1 Tax=Azospirillum baldaniorum TaxID=1064539 RepID=UPI001FE4BAF0|nr:hypothetical protein [Azospirillum baldaniorum]
MHEAAHRGDAVPIVGPVIAETAAQDAQAVAVEAVAGNVGVHVAVFELADGAQVFQARADHRVAERSHARTQLSTSSGSSVRPGRDLE